MGSRALLEEVFQVETQTEPTTAPGRNDPKASRVTNLPMRQQEESSMKRWHASIRYLDAHQVEQVWET